MTRSPAAVSAGTVSFHEAPRERPAVDEDDRAAVAPGVLVVHRRTVEFVGHDFTFRWATVASPTYARTRGAATITALASSTWSAVHG